MDFKASLPQGISASLLSEQDLSQIYKLCQTQPQYFKQMGQTLSYQHLKHQLTALPDSGLSQDSKQFWGFWKGKELIAFCELILKFPEEDAAIIGWFMVKKSVAGRGLGSELIQSVKHHLSKLKVNELILSYSDKNYSGKHFWQGQGFEPTGEREKYPEVTMITMSCKL
ncbi:GNAT family N-acetyltransferase [Lactobacillus mulieris]|uniref:GNAT family N-acetyltransferase n=1 Tax=Lactobacillus mulieris TaxID=2508708 RepID=UPI001433011B|nr:GNAT family N-acetyltransferase [Lactobacillus mulieris]MCF1783035.1 GNAT family N-acetyltransferase [Lactobacillus mulieris]MCW8104580.1 GNAT family N-acetyltransferase [Lactobacillus mulieris]MDK6803430.1 GNAT family N-acetyltransferase [Lactobacillus mulieris]MDK8382403.1 GNAT family N-acetyltransferase [Lactobacillus mulieris]MDT9620730.1 GNAT family N-acetyltransferase [Lactobacillus mulieris]